MTERASTEHFALGTKIAIEALKALLLVNGGAATALIALTTKAAKSPNYSIPVLLFGSAALLNSFTLVVGYFSQLSYANHCLSFENGEAAAAKTQLDRHEFMQWIAIGLVIAGFAFSVAGMATAFAEAR